MTKQRTGPDATDAAIAAVAAAASPKEARMVTFNVTIAGTGRQFQMAVPADLTADELREMVGWMATAMWQQLAAMRGPQLIVPSLVVARN